VNTKSAPPTRIRWVAVYEGSRVRLVPRAYRVRVSDPATSSAPAFTTPASGASVPTPPAPETPTSKDLPISSPVPPSPVPPSPVPPGPAPPSPALSAPAPSGPTASDDVLSERAVLANRAQALLKAKCVRCHGEQRQESGLDLRSRESILKGGESGPGLIPGQPDESLVLKRVRAGEMPPRNVGRLLPEEIATLQQWIAAGAPSERANRP
jgi:mono/diheme cytochrome c family protein